MLRSLLSIFENTSRISPDAWSFVDGESRAYDRDSILHSAPTEDADYIYLLRSGGTQMIAMLGLKQPWMSISVKLPPEEYASLFLFADQATAAFRPDFAVVGQMKLFAPWTSDEERDRTLISYCSSPSFVDYPDTGPLGLGERTYFGPLFIQQFGLSTLQSCPSEVTDTTWGGVRVDLTPLLWESGDTQLVSSWRASMAHLQIKRVFAKPRFINKSSIQFTKSKSVDLGPFNNV
jgi:hypothetical protein